MPRLLRPIDDGLICHVINCGNNRQDIFHKTEDFATFRRTNATGLPCGAYVVGDLERLKSNAWFGCATKSLVDTTIERLEAGDTSEVVTEMKWLQTQRGLRPQPIICH